MCSESEYCKISNIKCTKSPNLNVSRLVLQLSLPNPMKPGVQSRMKMQLEQCRQAMLQLHLSDWQFYCLLKGWLILETWRQSWWPVSDTKLHLSRGIIIYTLKSLSSLTQITHNLWVTMNFFKKEGIKKKHKKVRAPIKSIRLSMKTKTLHQFTIYNKT